MGEQYYCESLRKVLLHLNLNALLAVGYNVQALGLLFSEANLMTRNRICTQILSVGIYDALVHTDIEAGIVPDSVDARRNDDGVFCSCSVGVITNNEPSDVIAIGGGIVGCRDGTCTIGLPADVYCIDSIGIAACVSHTEDTSLLVVVGLTACNNAGIEKVHRGSVGTGQRHGCCT